MLLALVSMTVSMTSFPLSFRTAIAIASWWTSSPIPCGFPDYVELQYGNPVNRPFDEGFLDIVLVLPLR